MSLCITKEKFDEIKNRYENLLIMDSDTTEAFDFVHDVLIAEADALKERESYAKNAIARLEAAAHEVYDIGRDIDNKYFYE